MKNLKSFTLLLEDQSEKNADLLLITENGPTRFESVRFFAHIGGFSRRGYRGSGSLYLL